MRGAIVSGVATVAATGGLQRNPITVQKNILQSQPKETVPRLAAGIGEIKNRHRRTIRGVHLITDMLIKKRNRRSDPLHQDWPRIRKHPNVAKPVIFGIVVRQRIERYAKQR